jgi:hypothetical protein
MTTTTAAHTIGVARLELPLRGESLAAWLNSRFIGEPEPTERPREPCSTATHSRDRHHAAMAKAAPR